MISNERKTNVGKRFQYKRFKKYFQQKHASAYFTPEQEHLFNHTRGFCQPHTMVELNHCIEYMDGKCIFCVHNTAVKIIGVNKIVCLSCNKAYCLVCTTEVDPDPVLGVVHFSPDDGTLLSFIPGRCPLYTGSRVYKDLWGSYAWSENEHKVVKDCSICETLKQTYPEYELYIGKKEDRLMSPRSALFKPETREDRLKYPGSVVFTPEFYSCNLCNTKVDFLCQFDLHLRNHTKYGQSVAILGLNVDIAEASNPYLGHVNMENFMYIEEELMKTNGCSAVLTIFGKSTLEYCNLIPRNKSNMNVNLGAALLFKPGVDVEIELFSMFKKQRKREIFKNLVIFKVKNHFTTIYDTTFDDDARRSEISQNFLGVFGTRDFKLENTNLCKRNMALLENR